MKKRNYIQNCITTAFLLCCFSFLSLAAEKKIYTIDISTLDSEETAAVLALQGLANREAPQIMIEPKSKGGFQEGGYQVQNVNMQIGGLVALSPETLKKYPNLEDVWKDYYGNTYQYSFEEVGFQTLFQLFSSVYKGSVKYTGIPNNAGVAVAVTCCGQLDAIPVTASLLSKHAFLKDLPILKDLTTLGFKNKKDAHRWAIDEYLAKTSKDCAYSFWNAERNFYTIDYVVAKKLFAFDLSFANEKIHTDGGGTNYPYDNVEAGLLDEIFSYLNPGSIILGWGQPNEYILQARCGEKGHALICSNVSPNMSFHAAIPFMTTGLKQKRQLNDSDVKLENKIYITFSINEGDTYKSVGNLMNDGAWLHEKRGEIPFNWPVNPKILQIFPGLAEYYYDTMTTDDYFYSSTSGIGYFDSSFSTDEARTVYAEKNKAAFEYADIHYMDLWWNGFAGNDKWIASMGVKGYTTWTGEEKVVYTATVPRIESEIYYVLYEPTKIKASYLAQYIQEQTKNVNDRPWFVHVYASDPTNAAEVMRNLSPERFQAVCMDEFFALAMKAESTTKNKSISKNQTLIDQLTTEASNGPFDDEFSYSFNWIGLFANFLIENGEMIIMPTGESYYCTVSKSDLRFDIDRYPYLAVKVNQFPPNDLKWLLKMFDGDKDAVLSGEDKYLIEGYPGVYVWNIKECSGWAGVKSTNAQFVMEGPTSESLSGIQMKYDWVRSYDTIEHLMEDLAQGNAIKK